MEAFEVVAVSPRIRQSGQHDAPAALLTVQNRLGRSFAQIKLCAHFL
jgi:hypothetical protein